MKINKSIFKEYDIRGAYPEEISESIAFILGLAFARAARIKKIVVGRDARDESAKVFWPFIAGLSKGGVKIYSLDVCATPELFFAVGDRKFPAGCMVTASHSPAGQTGFKFCDSQGRVWGSKTGLAGVRALAAKINTDRILDLSVKTEKISIADSYKKFIRQIVDFKKISGFKLVLDASGGSGARVAKDFFSSLPVKTKLMNFSPNDAYPDHGLNPLLAGNWQSAAKEVKKSRADLGAVFDGDADRVIFIDGQGEFVEPYYINCLLAKIILEKKKRETIIADARLALGIGEVVKASGGQLISHRSGYANIIRTMQAKKIKFACENSGHFMFNMSWVRQGTNFAYGEGVLPLLIILQYLKRNQLSLAQAVAEYREKYLISGEINLPLKNFASAEKKIKVAFAGAKFKSIDGLSAYDSKDRWFFNFRASNTEPVARLNIEARDKRILQDIKKKLLGIIN
jgi:phosphomannomutase